MALLRFRGALLLWSLVACAAEGTWPAPSALVPARRGLQLRGPLPLGPPSLFWSAPAEAMPLVGMRPLALRGGADGAQQGGAADQMALMQTTDCKELVAALMSADNDVRVAAEKRYDALKVRACVSAPQQTRSRARAARMRANVREPDNSPRHAAQASFPDATTTALVQQVTAGAEEERAMAAVLTRTALPEMWDKLSDASREAIKRQLLLSLEAETSANMARKLANVVGALSFAVQNGGWPDLIPAMVSMCKSDVITKKEMAYHVLAILPHQIGDEIKTHFPQLSVLYESALTCADSKVHVSGMRALSSYLGMCDNAKEIKPLQSLLPAILAAVGKALASDEADARALIDTMIEINSINP